MQDECNNEAIPWNDDSSELSESKACSQLSNISTG